MMRPLEGGGIRKPDEGMAKGRTSDNRRRAGEEAAMSAGVHSPP